MHLRCKQFEISSETENSIPFPITLNTKVKDHTTVNDLPFDEIRANVCKITDLRPSRTLG
jgi:hypothetical protein